MFIARSAARVRFARTVFVLLGLLPCAGLVAAAVWLRSDGYREQVRRAWQRAVGRSLAIGALEQLRPGLVRARDCVLVSASGEPVVAVGGLDVETSAAEVRLRIDALACDARAVGILVGLAADWLSRPAFFGRDCLVEIGSFSWRDEPVAPTPLGALRLECVAREDARAVRAVLATGAEEPAGELRVVLTPERAGGVPSARLELEAACARPLPMALVAAAAGAWSGGLPGGRATVQGRLQAVRALERWSGSATGLVEHFDLAEGLPASGRGTAPLSLAVTRCEWQDGLLVGCAIDGRGGPGRIDRRVFDGLAAAGLLRRGVAAGSGSEWVEYDTASGTLLLAADGIRLTPPGTVPAPLATWRGQAVAEASAAVPFERLAWLWTPPAGRRQAAGSPAAALVSWLPRPPGNPPGDGVDERMSAPVRSERPGRRAEF